MAVDEGEPPPPELVLYWRCQTYNALPEVGAVLDQDYYLISKMTSLGNIHLSLSKYRNSVGEEVHSNLTEFDRNILGMLIDMKLIHSDKKR